MKTLALIAAFVLTAAASFAQAPSTGQWDIVATSETNSNTVDGGPLQFSTDWTTTTSGNATTISPLLAATFTNSTCSASGQPVNFTVSYAKSGKTTTTTIIATLDDNQTVTFTSTSTSSSKVTGTFTTSGGGCTQADSGKFTATLYSALQGSFSGTIESYVNTNTINVSMTINTSSTFAITGSVQSSNKACMANLTINGTAAQQWGPSLATGDNLYFFASDNNGNVVGFVASATDANGNMLSPAWPSQVYVTYQVVAGACAGDGGTDAPFQQVNTPVFHPHLMPRRLPIFSPRIAAPLGQTMVNATASATVFVPATPVQSGFDDASSSDPMHKFSDDSDSDSNSQER